MAEKDRKKKKKEYSLKPGDFNTSRRPTWCSGCGNYGIWNSLKKALVSLKLEPSQVLVVYGIGCSGNGANFLKTYSFHSLHGRALPVATGARLAAHKMTVLAMTGDGDGMGIGGNHFIHTCRRNINITNIMHDNRVYGLTTGQTSPTSGSGYRSKSTPSGVLEIPVNPVALAISSGATFVARGFSGDLEQLQKIMEKAIKHKGFSFIDVLQPCITFNKIDTYSYYREKIYSLKEIKGYDRSDMEMALARSSETERIPTGIFYRVKRPVYEEGLKQIERKPLTEHIINDVDISKLLNGYY